MTDLANFQPAIDHFEQELRGIRTGRAQPAVVEHLSVECYGAHTPLGHLASITAPEPQMLVVQPWDEGIVKDIEKALTQSSLGINPVVDGKLIRLPFPPMTEERRQSLEKVVHEKAETARVAVRKIREEQVKQLRQAEKDGSQSEDAVAVALKHLQTSVDQANEAIAALVTEKETELRTI